MVRLGGPWVFTAFFSPILSIPSSFLFYLLWALSSESLYSHIYLFVQFDSFLFLVRYELLTRLARIPSYSLFIF